MHKSNNKWYVYKDKPLEWYLNDLYRLANTFYIYIWYVKNMFAKTSV